jgi:hypothetical protein
MLVLHALELKMRTPNLGGWVLVVGSKRKTALGMGAPSTE